MEANIIRREIIIQRPECRDVAGWVRRAEAARSIRRAAARPTKANATPPCPSPRCRRPLHNPPFSLLLHLLQATLTYYRFTDFFLLRLGDLIYLNKYINYHYH